MNAMSLRLTRAKFLRAAAALGAGALPSSAQARSDEMAEITGSETATIDGRYWDTPIVGGRTMDAVHRSVLLRFPDAADSIAALLQQGKSLLKVELSLQYDGYEIVPPEYTCRVGLGRKLWTDNPPTWHVQAWPLRQPWIADKATGPTFNASVNGRRYWGRYGATDSKRDRWPDLMEPQELSTAEREARFDITKLLSTDVLARDMGARLLALQQCGFILRKVETYDTRYRQPGDAYEWAMPTGGHGLRFTNPRLLLTCRPSAGGTVAVRMPAPADRTALPDADNSRPTAVMLTPEELAERAARALSAGLERRQGWQLERIAELSRAGGDQVSGWAAVAGEAGYKAYQRRLSGVLAIPPRYWQGWTVADDLLVFHVFRDLLPDPAQDHMKEYWRAWLQPDLPTSAFVHPQSSAATDYYRRNHDWRGRASFFRDGYNFAVSTQNFNHTAAMGAVLGGAMIDAEAPMADGRHGLETLPLRFWSFLDGSTQEMLDHYYLSITLSAQKMFADFAPTPLDRLMGRIMVERTMELLISVHHPKVRRFIASSGRARLSGVLIEQDGIYGAVHSASRKGVANYLDRPANATEQGMPVWSSDFPPGRVAIQSQPSPWMPDWVAGLIDDKPLPFEETSAETTRGYFKPPLWRRTWLGAWHGLASADIRGHTVDVLGQWVREPRPATRIEDLGTLTVRYAVNEPDLATTRGGVPPRTAGLLLTYQSRNRAIIFAKPHTNRDRLLAGLGEDGVSRLATVVGLWNFSQPRTWTLYADGQKIETFPHRLKAGHRVLIHDGVSYLAILPLPASDLGRDVDIEIAAGIAGKVEPTGAAVAPALTLSIFNLWRDEPIAPRSLDLAAVATRTYGGLVLEMGDSQQHGSFEAFARHIAAAELKADWNEGARRLDVAYRSGGDLLEAGFTTDFPQIKEDHFPVAPGSQERAIPYRRLNGAWPYLPAGLERDTTWAQQGTTGRLEKAGAVLVGEPGRKAYLIADPLTGAVIGYNPLPDPQPFALAMRDGVTISADGKVGLLRVEYRPWEKAFDMSYALKPGQDGADMAGSFTISGLAEAPSVTLNGRPAEVRPAGQAFQIRLT